ncbi:semaphorin-2A-like [Aphidius gifuensis]|uniref:semaphorin-2A-like n=1 Tax=Aphidius gifuensis TaxID=684658 RepID=UPI001CDD5D46|nr:semaphorin-2A-like [Aphidius gifuensis]
MTLKNFEVSLNDSVNWKSPFSLKCSVARTRKATALMDPNGITLYSGVPRFNKSDYYSPSIFRTNFKLKNKGVLDPIDIQTSQNYKRIWPHGDEDYVGSFYVDHQVLFFFQETGSVDENKKIQIIDEISAETHRGHSDIPGGAETYFRVARVCKKDKGTSKKPRTWSTYAKARLNCSSFETMRICVFHIDDINRAFDGDFMKIYYKNNALSDPVNIPQARPKLCQENLKNYHSTSGDYSTMDTVIEPLMDGPIFELKNEQSYLTKIVADKISKSVCGNVVDLTVIYAGTSQGEVYKIIQWTEQGKIITKLQDKFQAIPEDEEIKAMEISSKHQSIYVASARRVKQINMKISEDLIKSLFNLKC